jgi:hypothetical protein
MMWFRLFFEKDIDLGFRNIDNINKPGMPEFKGKV